ncbi:unnamed protein product [Psylliodes chrysocephalus]|uniref:Uncharacterized protein n=1 Tax=Psylliodes chrysocephalus TaxID=3402493 RepID=A0A9P0G6C1_9CUCU|nr:unnamed protein product [Psylliodes chrysocephala]
MAQAGPSEPSVEVKAKNNDSYQEMAQAGPSDPSVQVEAKNNNDGNVEMALAGPSEPSVEVEAKNNNDSNENLMRALMHDVIIIENYCDNNLRLTTDEVPLLNTNANFVYLDLLTDNQLIAQTNIVSSSDQQILKTDQEDTRKNIAKQKKEDWIKCMKCHRWLYEGCYKFLKFCVVCGERADKKII